MRSILQAIIRTSSFIRKESVEVLRQTRLVLTLILGPFLILLLFGIGYREEGRLLRTLFVLPEGSELADNVQEYANTLGDNIEYAGMTHDPDEADRMLRRQQVDLVVVTPFDPIASIRQSEQAVFDIYHNEIDPYEEVYVQVVGRVYIEEVNRRLLQTIAEQGKAEAESLQETVQVGRQTATSMRQALVGGDALAARRHHETLSDDVSLLTMAAGSALVALTGMQENLGADDAGHLTQLIDDIRQRTDALGAIGTTGEDLSKEAETAAEIEEDLARLDQMLAEFREIDSDVLISPFRGRILSITEVALDPAHFYAPGVIALLLQHIAVTLAALSIIRERRAGTMELFRTSPVSAMEMLLGKYLSYLLFAGLITAALTILVIFVLRVPMLGDWWHYALVAAALLFASLGLGFLVSLFAQTNSQAVQYAMIVLLSSVFFGGFFLALYRLWEPVRFVSWLLPATYGTTLLQSIMLRGRLAEPILLLGLFAIGVVVFIVAWLRLRAMMAHE